jgi:hypothetical protein
VTGGSPAQSGPSGTVRRGEGTGRAAAPARRLTLTPAEWAVLIDGRLTDLPPGVAAPQVAVAERDDAVASLLRREVLLPADGASPAVPVPAVAGNLEVLRRPVLSVRLDVTGRAGARHGWFAVASGFVAGVLALPGGGVELSLAPDVRLGAELARAVPEAASFTGSGTPEAPAGIDTVPSGRLPLGLLDGVASPDVSGPPSPDETALAEELLRRTAGSLGCLVLGRAGKAVGAGQVSWLATDGGWVGLRPVLDGSPRRLVDVVPVRPADLGTWVAPAVAALLEAPDELA